MTIDIGEWPGDVDIDELLDSLTVSARFVIHFVDIDNLIAGMKGLSKRKLVTASMVEEFALDPTLQDLFTQNWFTMVRIFVQLLLCNLSGVC